MKNLCAALICLASFSSTITSASSAEERGFEIAKEVDKRDQGWEGRVSEIEMILENGRGQTRTRLLRNKVLEVQGDGDKSLTFFDEPRDVKGTVFLSYTHATTADDQWLFLPALKRVKRVSSANKSGPFMGSEFAYEDITSQELDKYSYRFIKEEVLGDHETYVLELKPEYEHSGYSKLIQWIDKDIYQARKIAYYDKKNSLLKTLVLSDYKSYGDQYWRAGRMEMENHQTEKSTVMVWKEDSLQAGLDPADFEKAALKRNR